MGGLGLLGVSALSVCDGGNSASSASPARSSAVVPDQGTHVVLLGTQGARSPASARHRPARWLSMGFIYVIDAGSGLPLRFSEILRRYWVCSSNTCTRIMWGLLQLRYAQLDQLGLREADSRGVRGPAGPPYSGAAGSPVRGLHVTPTAPLVTPILPPPGIADITALSIQANAYDLNERATHIPMVSLR